MAGFGWHRITVGTMEFLQSFSLIVLIQVVVLNLLLSADNAVAIALACRKLDDKQRQWGILWGTVGTMVLRLALVFVAIGLLTIPGLKIVAALLLVWVALRLMQQGEPEQTSSQAASSLLAAVSTVVVADFVMSLDNVLAISGAVSLGMPLASPGAQLFLVLIGLAVSLPVVVFGSMALVKLMQRYPLLVLVGVGLLGWIAGGMLITDVLVLDQFGPVSTLVKLTAQVMGAVLVILLARYWAARRPREN